MDTACKQFLKYTSLNIPGMLGISFYILADTFFIANGIGADGLAALNLAIPVYSFIHGCGLMLGTGGSTKYIIAKYQGEQKRADIVYTAGIKLGLLFAFIFVCFGLFGSRELTVLLKADEALYDMTNTYLKVILLFAPFFITNEQLLAYVRSDGNPSLAMTAMVSGSIANIILDYIFIYPLHMGILGAVLATGIAPIISMLIMGRHLNSKTCGFHLTTDTGRLNIITELIVLGFPSLVTELSAGIIMIVFNLLIMQLNGNMGVAAYGIIANIALVTTAICTGLAQGVQPLISEAYSKKNQALLRKYTHLAISTAIFLSAILFITMCLCAAPITAIFNQQNNPILQTLGECGMRLYFTSLPLTAFNILFCALFTATERPLPAHLISVLRGLIIVLPLSYWMAYHFGLSGIWLTVTVTELLSAITAISIWKKSQ